MGWQSILFVALATPLLLLTVAFVAYLNVGGALEVVREARRKVQVLVVDDHAVVREGIRALLSVQRDMRVVGEAENGREALEKVVQLSPDVVIMDLRMPMMDGLEAARWMNAERKRARVLILSQYDDAENVAASSQVGALGFISKTHAGPDLVKGIRAVSKGERFMAVNASAS
jgi:DNA-binding NarL/FixJ family response regulator